MSDMVVLHQNGKNSAHYVDSTDYTEMPHFIRGLESRKEKEQGWQNTDPALSEGRQARLGSLRQTLEEYRILSEKEGKNHPAGRQEKEASL